MNYLSMIRGSIYGIIIGLLFFTSCSKNNVEIDEPEDINFDTTFAVKLSGNSYITEPKSGYSEIIHPSDGLTNWTNKETIISTYVKVLTAGKIDISLKGKLLDQGSGSEISVSINGITKSINLTSNEFENYSFGVFDVPAGYLKIDLQGVSKTHQSFGQVSDILISVLDNSDGVIYCSDPRFYQKSLNGPFNYFQFQNPVAGGADYYYYELNIPTDSDSITPFSVTTDFGEGFFSFKPQSGSKAKLVFYITTASPAMDPYLFKVLLNRKGENVTISGLNGTGPDVSGTLEYAWSPTNTYKILLHAKPDNLGNTDYTAWYYPPEENKWKLLASFKREWTERNLSSLMGSLINDNISFGYLGRRVNFSNIWVYNTADQWKKVEEATYHIDDLVLNKQRLDAYHGNTQNGIFLMNGGFFNESSLTDTLINISNSNSHPVIDFSTLP